MDWFRMYGEFASDAKVQSMPEAMQRRLIMLLCLRCSNALVTLQEDEIAFALRISDAELVDTKALFQRKGFITGEWEIANWNKRQFASDSSAPRVAAHRARQKELAKQDGNVTETPQNRTDTEQKQNREEKACGAGKPLDADFETAWGEYPKRPGASKSASLKAWNARLKAGADALDMIAGVKRYAAYVEFDRTEPRFIKQPATFFGPDEHFHSDWAIQPRASPAPNQQPNRQEALEQRNLEIAARLAGETA